MTPPLPPSTASRAAFSLSTFAVNLSNEALAFNTVLGSAACGPVRKG
eukprot:CAMPEP_0171777856 /NCGR_PEP_ID=MMETSP0991-20121206/58036_1 /TAXON_ID=483369 /ORGANISM="non described non described, Strain CCMP2098" /LENGTH=46 /DNA_ID= /DNA_START= /DNA_END= /DNA_ORIENTATION=